MLLRFPGDPDRLPVLVVEMILFILKISFFTPFQMFVSSTSVSLSRIRKDGRGANQNNKNDRQFFDGARASHCRHTINPMDAHQQPVFFLDNTGS